MGGARKTTKKEAQEKMEDKPTNETTPPKEDESKQLLITILSEIKEIKKQNETYKEEMKRDITELRNTVKNLEGKNETTNNMMKNKINNLENTMVERMKEMDTRINELTKNEEKRQKRERRNNLIIKSADIEARKDNIVAEVREIFKTIEVEAKNYEARYIGKDWKGRGLALIEVKAFEDKLKIMRNKRKLSGRDCYIEDDMTKQERNPSCNKKKGERRKG